MKKVYMTPETTLHEVVLNQMIAASVPAIVEPEEETAEQEDVVLSRRKDKWDDQEEEKEW